LGGDSEALLMFGTSIGRGELKSRGRKADREQKKNGLGARKKDLGIVA